MGTLKGKDILHGNQFSKGELQAIMKVASDFEKELKGKGTLPLLKEKLVATLFFEPSTRTRMSFEAAMQRLGGGVVSMGAVEGSSVAKGETLSDTARTVAQYADVIVIRHPKMGSAKEVAEAVRLVSSLMDEGTTIQKESPASDTIFIGCTSLGIHLSAGKIEHPAGDIEHYALSSQNGRLAPENAGALTRLILQLKPGSGPSELLEGSQNVFHLLIYPLPGKSSGKTPDRSGANI